MGDLDGSGLLGLNRSCPRWLDASDSSLSSSDVLSSAELELDSDSLSDSCSASSDLSSESVTSLSEVTSMTSSSSSSLVLLRVERMSFCVLCLWNRFVRVCCILVR